MTADRSVLAVHAFYGAPVGEFLAQPLDAVLILLDHNQSIL